MKNLLLITSFMILGLNAYAGIDKGNGGDICENKMRAITNNIQSWLIKGHFKDLNLPASISFGEYKDKMLLATSETALSCTSEKLFVGKSEKTCKNFTDEDGVSRINCNFARFMETPESEQYRLMHHEFAGVAGFESNNGQENSNYFISNQIGDFLSYKSVLVLGIKSVNQTIDVSVGVKSSKPYIEESDRDYLMYVSKIRQDIANGSLKCLLKVDLYKKAYGISGLTDFRSHYSLIEANGQIKQIIFWSNGDDGIQRMENLSGLSKIAKCHTDFEKKESTRRDLGLE